MSNPVKIINLMDEKKSKRAVNVLQWIKELVNTLISLFKGKSEDKTDAEDKKKKGKDKKGKKKKDKDKNPVDQSAQQGNDAAEQQ
jgi:DNA-binding protein H-NS